MNHLFLNQAGVGKAVAATQEGCISFSAQPKTPACIQAALAHVVVRECRQHPVAAVHIWRLMEDRPEVRIATWRVLPRFREDQIAELVRCPCLPRHGGLQKANVNTQRERTQGIYGWILT